MVELNLRNQGLYSEDLFILAKVLSYNNSIKVINLSKNYIGYTFVEARKILEFKMKHQNKIKHGNFEQMFYSSLGIQHFANSLSSSDRLKELDFSENDIGTENFELLLKIFESNTKITHLNLSDCNINDDCVANLCATIKQSNFTLKDLKFRNSKFSEKSV